MSNSNHIGDQLLKIIREAVENVVEDVLEDEMSDAIETAVNEIDLDARFEAIADAYDVEEFVRDSVDFASLASSEVDWDELARDGLSQELEDMRRQLRRDTARQISVLSKRVAALEAVANAPTLRQRVRQRVRVLRVRVREMLSRVAVPRADRR